MWWRRDRDHVETLGRAGRGDHEVALRRRTTSGRVIHELIVNGAFAMDSTDVSSEIALADTAADARTALVGGLGLGYTGARLLEHGVRALDVVELEPSLIEWAKQGLTPTLEFVGGNPRVRLHHGDLGDVLAGRAGPKGPWDAILFDVDNGPDFLIHQGNATLYQPAALAAAMGQLNPGGVLAIWCQQATPSLRDALESLEARVKEMIIPVRREGRDLAYAIYVATRR